MLIDITLKITRVQLTEAMVHNNPALIGHAGTHFDVMDKEFPLVYTERKGIVFDVSHVEGRDIGIADIDLNQVEKDMFVLLRTGFIEQVPYGAKTYFTGHPQLSVALIDALVEKKISLIGLDFAGIRRTPEHIPMDQHLADNDIFVIENLVNLKALPAQGKAFTVCTYPMNCSGMTGLPCRVIVRNDE